jgi:hypothetical protein
LIVVPYTRLHARTRAALSGTDAVYWRLDRNDDRSYWKLLASLWGGELVIVEHDVEIHQGVLPGFASCPEPWCTFPFARLLRGPHSSWTGSEWGPGIALLEKSLGCTRFSAELARSEPDLMEELGELSLGGQPPGHWKRLDDGIAHLLERRGYKVHVHHPEVIHHHWLGEQGWDACTCGADCAA